MESIINGLIAGLIASLFVVIVVKFFLGFIIPRIRKKLHVGLDLTGSWETKKVAAEFSLSDIYIKQYGHDIFGHFKLSSSDSAPKSFDFKGKCLDRVVMARFYRTKGSDASCGTILLDSFLNNGLLKGCMCIISSDNSIVKQHIELGKKDG